jgi:hypothetical protein
MSLRLAGVAVVATCASVLAVGTARADLVDPSTSADAAGNIASFDPAVDEFEDAAPAADDPSDPQGAVVGSTSCLIRNPVFRKVVRTPGHIVITPSGNIAIVCHGQLASPSILFDKNISQALVVQDAPCFFGKRQLSSSILVVTPSLNVTFVCHDNGS